MPSLDDLLFTYGALLDQLGVNGLLALSVWIVLATGQLSLGQAAFMGMGAYAGALLSMNTALPFALVVLIASAAPALLALLIGIPTLRLSGVYLALSTIGLGEVLRAAYLNLDDWTGGALGLNGIPERASTLEIWGALALSFVVLWVAAGARIGRAAEAIRLDPAAAQTCGIDPRRYRLAALLASAALAGLAGCLSAHRTDFIGPNEYGFQQAVSILAYAVLGGIGTPAGPLLGAAILTLLPELLRGLGEARMILIGAVITLTVLFLPRGLLAWRVRRA